MKVKRLELKGFRGFDEIVLDFDTNPQRPTVFIGNNGVGKSSILDSLAILLSWFIKRVEFDAANMPEHLVDNTYYHFKHNLLKGRDFSSININNNYSETEGKILVNYQLEDSYWSILWKKNYLTNTIFGMEINSNTHNLENLTNKIFKERLVLPIIVYYSIKRKVDKFSLEIQNVSSEIQNVSSSSISSSEVYKAYRDTDAQEVYRNSLSDNNVDFEIFFQWCRNTEDLENERIRDDANYQDKQLFAVRNAINSLIPEFDNLRVRRSPLRMTVNKTIGDKVEELSINQLSDGEKCLLAMVGDIARRLAIANPSLDDPLQGEGIVLIDEIELHLHPQWQHKIIPRLTETFPNCQFIVTTHSPQVLSHVQPENIYILQSTPNGIIASHPESSYGRDSNQILEDYMGTPERPQDIKDKILEIFRVIDQNDLGQAKDLCESLGSKIGSDEPELIRARAVIKRKEILGK
jgi:predicted ATP-binding protein involved in virulence